MKHLLGGQVGPTLRSSYPCTGCGSFLFKEPRLCFWCLRDRDNGQPFKAVKVKKAVKKDRAVKAVLNKWLED